MEANTSGMVNLNGSNYQLWKTRMEDLLYVNGFHEPIACSGRPQDKTDEEWNLLHRRVCGYIRQWVDDSILTHVSGEINAHTLWSKLGQLYAPKTCDTKRFLIKQLMGLRYHVGTAMSDHLNIFQGIINRLSETGVKIDDEVQGLWLLGTLPDSWESVGTGSLLNLMPDGVISADLVKSSVLNEEMRRKSQGSTLCSNTLSTAAAQMHTIIKVARDENIYEQIGKSIYFDLVDHDKVSSFRVQNQISFALFKEEVAKEFGIPVQFQRFWLCLKRKNHTFRPCHLLTPQEEAEPVEILRRKADIAELKLFLEDSRTVPPPAKTKDEILLFFKLYDPSKQELRYVGRLFVKGTSKPKEIVTKLNELAGFAPGQEIQLFEEITCEPNVMCEHVDKEMSFRASQLEDGGIICFQKLLHVEPVKYRYPNVPSFLEHVRNRQPEDEEMLAPHSEFPAAEVEVAPAEATNTVDASAETANTVDAPAEAANTVDAPAEAANRVDAPADAANTVDAPAEAANTVDAPAEAANTVDAPVEATNTVDAPIVDDLPSIRFTWTIENFSRLNSKKLYSDVFDVGGYKWRVLIYPKGNGVEHLSVYLDAVNSTTLPYARFSLAVVNQTHRMFTVQKDTEHQFNARESDWGFTRFMPLSELYDPSRGYLLNDTCIIEADVVLPKVVDD